MATECKKLKSILKKPGSNSRFTKRVRFRVPKSKKRRHSRKRSRRRRSKSRRHRERECSRCGKYRPYESASKVSIPPESESCNGSDDSGVCKHHRLYRRHHRVPYGCHKIIRFDCPKHGRVYLYCGDHCPMHDLSKGSSSTSEDTSEDVSYTELVRRASRARERLEKYERAQKSRDALHNRCRDS